MSCSHFSVYLRQPSKTIGLAPKVKNLPLAAGEKNWCSNAGKNKSFIQTPNSFIKLLSFIWWGSGCLKAQFHTFWNLNPLHAITSLKLGVYNSYWRTFPQKTVSHCGREWFNIRCGNLNVTVTQWCRYNLATLVGFLYVGLYVCNVCIHDNKSLQLWQNLAHYYKSRSTAVCTKRVEILWEFVTQANASPWNSFICTQRKCFLIKSSQIPSLMYEAANIIAQSRWAIKMMKTSSVFIFLICLPPESDLSVSHCPPLFKNN